MKDWEKNWLQFKKTLPHQNYPYSKRNWGTSLHSLCSYSGKLKPSLTHHLVDTFAKEGDVLMDPFSGSGTVALEAGLQNVSSISFDISDMAVAITNAKVNKIDQVKINNIIEMLDKKIQSTLAKRNFKIPKITVGFNKEIAEYFHIDTLKELVVARDFFMETKNLKDPNWCLLFSSLLHVLHGNRPYALSRRSHPLTPYAPQGDFIYKNVVEHMRVKAIKSINEKQTLHIKQGKVYKHDILEKWPVKGKSVDVVITSPPFVSSTRFYMTNWMRFWLAGWEKDDFENASQKFIEQKQIKSLDSVYTNIFKNLQPVMKKNGVVIFHVGKNKKTDMGKELSNIDFEGFQLYDRFIEDTSLLEMHGIKDKGSTVEHQYLVYIAE